MNLISKILLLVLLLAVPAHAQEITVGQGIVCDRPEQVARFITALSDDAQATADKVNAEFDSPVACILAQVAFVKGDELEAIRNKNGLWKVTAILVVAIQTPRGWQRIAPRVFFSALKTDEREA